MELLSENKNGTKIKCQLLIPENYFIPNVDNRDIKLAAFNVMRSKYSKGSVDLIKNGRYYLLEYIKEVCYNI